jgi:hypothetical protein
VLEGMKRDDKKRAKRTTRFGCDGEIPHLLTVGELPRLALAYLRHCSRLHTLGACPPVTVTWHRTDAGSRGRVNESRHCSLWPFHNASRFALAVKCSMGGSPEAHASCECRRGFSMQLTK